MTLPYSKWRLLFLIGILIISNLPAVSSDYAGDYNILRVENEDKLVVPQDKLEEVWKYLTEICDNNTYFKQLNPEFNCYYDNEYFRDTYFDTRTLQMLDKNSSVRHRYRTNLDDPTNKKNERELVQIKLSGIDNNSFNRGEFKYKVKYPSKFKTQDDMHPVLGIIDRDIREDFKNRTSEIGINPYSLRKILILEQNRRSLYITKGKEPFISIRLDEDSSKFLWAKWEHIEIEPELNEIPYTEGTPEERQYMVDTNHKIIEDIMAQFPEIKRDLTPKYNKAFNYFEKKIPLLRFLIRYDII
jgi:hypothetical protein